MLMHSVKLSETEYLEYFPNSLKTYCVDSDTDEMLKRIYSGETYDDIRAKGIEISLEDYQKYVSLMSENIVASIPKRNKAHLEELVIHISNDCNLACTYCYGDGGTYHSERCLMKPETLIETLDKFYAIYPSIDIIQLFGGEPMLNPQLIRIACEYVKNNHKNSIVGMVSNGTIVTDELIDLIKEYGFKITFSVDIEEMQDVLRPTRGGKGTYNKVLNNFRRLREETCEPSGIEVTYTKQHLDAGYSVADTIKMIREVFGDVPMIFNPVSSVDVRYQLSDYQTFVDSVDELFKTQSDLLYYGSSYIYSIYGQLKEKKVIYHSCNCGYGKCAVSTTGDIFACQSFVGDNEYKFANIHEPIDILTMKLEKRADEFYEYDKINSGECKDCYMKTICKRCVHDNKLYTGDIHTPNKLQCEMQKAIFDKVLVNIYKSKQQKRVR